MRLQDRVFGTCLSIAAAAALAPGRADACSSDSRLPGLELYEPNSPPDALFTAVGGVVALYGSVSQQELVDAAATVTVTLRREGEMVATTVELMPLGASIFRDAPLWTVAVVARPNAPLQPGAYEIDVAVDREYVGLDEFTFPLTVEEGPLTPLEPPTAATVEASEVASGYGGQICCEREADSCGGKSSCLFTTTENVPALAIAPTRLPAAQAGNSVIWAQRLDADGMPDPAGRFQFLGRHDVVWEVPFLAAQEEYCVVLGATNLVDGTSVSSAPVCRSREEVGEPRVVTREVPPDAFEDRGCLTPPIYEDGTPFGEEAPAAEQEPSGCRLAGEGGAWAWLGVMAGLGLGVRRRRG